MSDVCQTLPSELPSTRGKPICPKSQPRRGNSRKKRYAIVDGLLHLTHRTRAAARANWGGGVTWMYELLARLRSDARLTSLIPRQRGRGARGDRQGLGGSREEIVRAAIDEIYLTRQQPRVSTLVLEIRQRLSRAWLARLPAAGRWQRRIDQRLVRGRSAIAPGQEGGAGPVSRR